MTRLLLLWVNGFIVGFMETKNEDSSIDWNEWDPLKHVIVGRADDCHIPPEEPALDAKVPEDSDMRGQWGERPQETIDRANELLDNFASLLEKEGNKGGSSYTD